MSDCACLYGGYDEWDEHPFSCTEVRTARKEHRCRECLELIPKGMRYQHYAGKSDGEVFTVKTCLTCAEIRKSLYCDGYYFGSLWADVKEQLFPRFTVACVDKLSTVEAKQELTRRYREFLGVA